MQKIFPPILARFTLVVAVVLLTGCGGTKVAKRNFNELVPRMMSAIQRGGNNPDQATANLFSVTSADERRDAIAYLETQKYGHEPAYMRAYKLLTTDPSPMVRAQAMRALGSSRDNAVVPYLVDGTTGKTGMADLDPEVRRDACQCFLRVFSEAAVPIVINHLANDPDDQVRICCARCLHNTTSHLALRALISALDDKNAAVVYWAHETLMANTGNAFDFDPKTWLAWYEQTYTQPTTRPASSS